MEINKDIISEINGAPKIDRKIKEFLIWLVNFEREHLDKERPGYKPDIVKKLDEIIKGEDDNQKKK
jgi:hypothetical protein